MELIILRGHPGSGKTTLARTEYGFHILCEADHYFEEDDGTYCYRPSEIRHAHEWCQSQVRTYLEMGEPVVVANTFTFLWELKPYLDMAKKIGVPVTIRRCTGEFENVHGVPFHVVERMKRNYTPHHDETV